MEYEDKCATKFLHIIQLFNEPTCKRCNHHLDEVIMATQQWSRYHTLVKCCVAVFEASLSKPHTSENTLYKCMVILACLLAWTDNHKS